MSTRSGPRPPSSGVRLIGRSGVPLGVLFGLLAVVAAAAGVLDVVTGGGPYRVLLAAGQAAFLGSIAYGVGVELPRVIREWDAALAAREQLRR